MDFGKKVRERRLELGMSQQKLAEKIGLETRGAINKIESGSVNVDQEKIFKLAIALSVTPSYLMDWDNEKPLHLKKDKVAEMISNLSDEETEQVENFIRFLESQRQG